MKWRQSGMTTAKFCFSGKRFFAVYRSTLRRNRASMMLTMVLGFLFLPLQYLLTAYHYNRSLHLGGDPESIKYMLGGVSRAYNAFSAFAFSGMMLFLSICFGVVLFQYLHNKRSVDVYHALPISRSELYYGTAAAGITMLWVPLIVNFAIVILVANIVPLASRWMLFTELLCWMVLSFSLFAVTAFAAVQVGTVFDCSIFSLGILAAPSVFYLVIYLLAQTFLYGFSSTDWMATLGFRLSAPGVMLWRHGDFFGTAVKNQSSFWMMIWFFLSLLILVLGDWYYRRRRSEVAEAVGQIGVVSMLLRGIGTLAGGTALGFLLSATLSIHDSKPGMLLCIAASSVLVYLLGDIILARSIKTVAKAIPGALMTAGVTCGIVAMMMYGGLGYETRIPAVTEVQSVTISYYNDRMEGDNDYRSRHHTLSDPAVIEAVQQAHAAHLDSWKSGETNGNLNELHRYYDGGQLRMAYHLANGKTLERQYYQALVGAAREAMLPLETNEEYLRQSQQIFAIDEGMVGEILLTNALGTAEQTVEGLSLAQKKALLEAMRTDLLSQTTEDLKSEMQAIAYLEMQAFLPAEDENQTDWPAATRETARDSRYGREEGEAWFTTLLLPNDSHTLSLLSEWGYGDALVNDFSQVESAQIGILRYEPHDASTVLQTARSDFYRFDEDLVMDEWEKTEYPDRQSYFLPLTSAELTALRKNLKSVKTNLEAPTAVVAITAEQPQQDASYTIGYYFVDLEKLEPALQQKLTERFAAWYPEEKDIIFPMTTAATVVVH